VKNPPAKKIFGQVSIAHGIIILLTILMSSFRGCTPKQTVTTWVDLSGELAPAPSYEPEPETAPEPEIKTKSIPEPKPEPKPEKKLTSKPVITNTPPKKVETNAPPKKAEIKKPVVTNTPPKKATTNAPPKPKTEAEKLAAMRQNNRVPNPNAKPSTPSRKPIDYSGLQSALNSSVTTSGSGASTGTGSGSGGGMYSPFGWYYDSVKQQMYAVWQQPAGAPIGLTVTATVRVERDGTVSLKSITRRTGNALFDQSVQNALNMTTRLPTPPVDLPDRNIEIVFELSD
jgi:outer membrane biosynthesis protein TonB